jgi:GntR family transcriptional regulator / MocR family aminotransferase
MTKLMEPVLPFELPAGRPASGLTRNLHRELRTAILERKLPSGFALPSTRRLAQALGVGRNTVITVYGLLVAEGYVEARRGARFCVIGASDNLPQRSRRTASAITRETDTRLAVAWRKPTPRLALTAPLPARSFRTGVPENRFFDHAIWRRLTARALRAEGRAPFTYGPAHGLPPLREAIAGHVAFARAVVCGPDDIVVTSGAQQAFDLLARLLVTPGQTRVAVENPGFPPLRAALIAAGARLVAVPVDAEGLRVDRVPDGVKVICVTPSHQSPTGAVMSRTRRIALLTRARELGASVIEDDYDGEFLYDTRPQDALQMLDREARVFYVGTFSKSLFPALRKGFIVTPYWARAALIDAKYSTDNHCDVLTQATLAAFLAEGYLARHIRRMRPIYSQRRNALASAIQEHLSRWLEVLPDPAGLHLTARIRESAFAVNVVNVGLQHLPGALPLTPYTIGKPYLHGLCIGYGCVEVEQITRAVREMGRALRGFRRHL